MTKRFIDTVDLSYDRCDDSCNGHMRWLLIFYEGRRYGCYTCGWCEQIIY